jgi:hypothetical protein
MRQLQKTKTIPRAGDHNAVIDAVTSLRSRTSDGGLSGFNGTGGPGLTFPGSDEFYAKITGGTNPYSWDFTAHQSGSWTTIAPGGTAGSPGQAWELNASTDIPSGHIVTLLPGFSGDRVFQVRRLGTPTPTPTPPPVETCCPCSVPKTNLTLAISGGPSPGNVTLVFNPTAVTWTSACVNGVVYTMQCAGSVGLTASVFTDTDCNPAGGSVTCESAGQTSRNIPLTSFNCSPFSFTFSATSSGCPFLSESGYTGFTVTGPTATICVCTAQIIPAVFLTDASGTHDLSSFSLLSVPTPPVSPTADPNAGCNGTPTTAPTCVSYGVVCSAGPTPDKLTMTVTRQWVTCGCTGGQQYQSGPGVGAAQCPNGQCTPGGTGMSIGSATISGTPWSASVTLTQSGTSTLPDPMGDAPIVLSS